MKPLLKIVLFSCQVCYQNNIVRRQKRWGCGGEDLPFPHMVGLVPPTNKSEIAGTEEK